MTATFKNNADAIVNAPTQEALEYAASRVYLNRAVGIWAGMMMAGFGTAAVIVCVSIGTPAAAALIPTIAIATTGVAAIACNGIRMARTGTNAKNNNLQNDHAVMKQVRRNERDDRLAKLARKVKKDFRLG